MTERFVREIRTDLRPTTVSTRAHKVPNDTLRSARLRRASPSGSGRPMSRQELADAANGYLPVAIDDKYIGKLERGIYRWPNRQHRAALRRALDVETDVELGFYVDRPQPSAKWPTAHPSP